MSNFKPVNGSTVKISATATHSHTALGAKGGDALLQNTGPNVAFVRLTTGDTTATTADLAVVPGVPLIVARAPSELSIGAICATGETATLYVTLGDGS